MTVDARKLEAAAAAVSTQTIEVINSFAALAEDR